MKRNYGIDLLKIVAMFMVVMGHVLLSGGVNEAVSQGVLKGSATYYTVFGVRLVTICAVNCFVLATGYLYYGRNVKLSRLVELWLQVVFLSVLFLAGSLVLGFRPTGLQYLKTFLPLSTYHYWFITQYMLLMLFVPILNRLVMNLEGRGALYAVAVLVFVFSVLPTFLFPVEIPMNGGYTVVWFCVLYVVGACIRKFDIPARIRASHALGLFVCGWFAGLVLAAYGKFSSACLGMGGGYLCYQYNAPSVLLETIALALFFMRLDVQNRTFQILLSFVSPLVFGVYVLHSNCIFRELVGWDGRWTYLAEFNCIFVACQLVLITGLIFVCCAALDLVRKRLFSAIKSVTKRGLQGWECH